MVCGEQAIARVLSSFKAFSFVTLEMIFILPSFQLLLDCHILPVSVSAGQKHVVVHDELFHDCLRRRTCIFITVQKTVRVASALAYWENRTVSARFVMKLAGCVVLEISVLFQAVEYVTARVFGLSEVLLAFVQNALVVYDKPPSVRHEA